MYQNKIDTIVVLDTETTGLDYFKYEAIQISGISIQHELVSGFDYHIESEGPIEEGAAKINGYYHGRWAKEGKTLLDKKVIAEKLFQTIKDADIIVAHNSPFDRGFVTKFITQNSNHTVSEMPKYWFDTATIAMFFKFFTNEFEKTSLDYLMKYFNLTHMRSENHDSLEDSKILKAIFEKLIEKLKS